MEPEETEMDGCEACAIIPSDLCTTPTTHPQTSPLCVHSRHAHDLTQAIVCTVALI